MKRILAMVFGSLAFLALIVFGALLVMPEDDLAALVRPLPVIGSHADSIVDFKRDVGDSASHMVDDTLYSLSSTWRSFTDFSLADQTQRVVIELEPVRDRKPKAPPEAPTAPSADAPQPLTPQPDPSSMSPPPSMPAAPSDPATETSASQPDMMPREPNAPADAPPAPPPTMASTDAMTAAPGQPEMPAPEKTETAEHKSAESHDKPVAPEPATETKQAMTAAKDKPVETTAAKAVAETKMAALPTPVRKPPPPAPVTDNGSAEHKKGLTYYKGIGGVAKNYKTAAQWFRESSAKGNAAAQYNLGIMAYLGQGEEQSFAEAAKWFRQAANQDHALAQYNLGFLYYEGKGVEKDDLQAFMWIDRAARLGDEKAIKARDTLEKILPADLLKGR